MYYFNSRARRPGTALLGKDDGETEQATRIRVPHRLPTSAILAIAAPALLLGCSAHQPGTVGGSPPTRAEAQRGVADAAPSTESERARLAERYEAGEPAEARAVRVREALDAAYEQGRAARMAGDLDAAFDAFDRALDQVLGSGLALEMHPELEARAEAVMAAIHEVAVEEAATRATLDDGLRPAALGAAGIAPVPSLEATSPPLATTTASAGTPGGPGLLTAPLTVPMSQDPSVDSMVRFYTGRVRDRFEVGLQRYGLYAPTVRRILAEEGVPPELAWLALVESNYNAQAYSRARAKGLWQFIPSTGQNYGLRQNFWVDERADFEKATRSAARYLKTLHAEFGDWHLALAAYNAGEGRMRRAIRATGTRDFWRIRRTRHIRRETKDYVPAFLAVLRIVGDPAAHGITPAPAAPLQWQTARIGHCADLSVIADLAGCTPEDLLTLNPELRQGCTPGDTSDYCLRVPAAAPQDLAERVAQLPEERRLRWHRHVVRRGETLSTIAGRYSSSVAAIMAANDIRNANRISVGWTLTVPTGATARAASTPQASAAPTRQAPVRTTYRVRPGDTLTSIARRHGTTVARLASWNGLTNAHRIRVGQRLTLHGGSRPSGSSTTHVVRRGDTLSTIAHRNGVSVSQLRAWNDLGRSTVIHPGQRLELRGPALQSRTHTVRRGDTLYEIARTHRTTVDKLRRWNDLNRSRHIRPGDRLTIYSN